MIWVKISLANAFVNKNLPSKTPLARKFRLHHPADKKISKLRHITRQHNLLSRFREADNHQKFPPSLEDIKEYKEIDKILVKARSKANYSVRRLHISKVKSSRTVKLSQLRLRLINLLIQRIDK